MPLTDRERRILTHRIPANARRIARGGLIQINLAAAVASQAAPAGDLFSPLGARCVAEHARWLAALGEKKRVTMNYMRTAVLLAALTAFLVGLGYLLGGKGGALIALCVAIATNAMAYWNGDRLVLSTQGAQEVDEHTEPELVHLVADLAGRAGLPMPRVFVVDDPQPNAFATGRNPHHAAVAATTGLLDLLSPEEGAGVIAHELAHIKNRDTLIMTITATIAGAITMLAQFGTLFHHRDHHEGPGPLARLAITLLAPVSAMVVQMAISRTREYAADRLGAQICGHPEWLASALERMEAGVHESENEAAERNPAVAHMFIINPLSGRGMDNLFSTHPSTENRIAALEQLADEMGVPPHDEDHRNAPAHPTAARRANS